MQGRKQECGNQTENILLPILLFKVRKWQTVMYVSDLNRYPLPPDVTPTIVNAVYYPSLNAMSKFRRV